MEVRLEHLRPREIRHAMEQCPTLYQPLGTVEWHGEHNIVGLDSLKAHALCVRAAEQAGGLVAPPLYGGVGGIEFAHTWVMDPENDAYSQLLRPWLEKLCLETVRNGFKAIIILTGHYGAAQQLVVRETAVRMTRLTGVPILGTPEYFLAHDEGYLGDHAAWGETSLMMHLDPPSVDLARLGDEPHPGVFGRDPKAHATATDGERLARVIVARLATLAAAMPTWDADTIARFNRAEAALVGRQLEMAGREKLIWAAWKKVADGYLAPYGRLLAAGDFEAIEQLAAGL